MDPLQSYRDSHSAWVDPAAQPPWLATLRAEALARFESTGFPTSKVEAWKYSSAKRIGRVPFRHQPGSLDGIQLPEVPHQVVVVNGRVCSVTGDLPEGLEVRSLAEKIAEDPEAVRARLAEGSPWDDPFVSLNRAFFHDGLWVEVARGVVIEAPVHIQLFSSAPQRPAVAHPLTLVTLGANAGVTVVEHHHARGPEATFNDAVTECVVGGGSRLSHQVVHRGASGGFRVGRVVVSVGRDASYENLTLSLGGGWERQDLVVNLDAPGASCRLHGLYLPAGDDHTDHHVTLNHNAPHCTSHTQYKGVLGGRGRAVFNGRVMIAEGAVASDANLSNRNVLLSQGAMVDTKPELEIYNDDVKAAHGTTVGELDEAQVYYLRTRGLTDLDARRLLTEAFASELVDVIRIPSLREQARAWVAERLASVHGEAP